MMDKNDFLKLADLLEQSLASNAALLSSQKVERLAFEQIMLDLKGTIEDLNKTIGTLLMENRLLEGPKKNSGSSSIATSKD